MSSDIPEGYSVYRISEGYSISYLKNGLGCAVYENGKQKIFRKEEKAIEYAKQHAVKRIAERQGSQYAWCPFCSASVYIDNPLKYWCESCFTVFYIKKDKVWFDKSKQSFASHVAKIENSRIDC